MSNLLFEIILLVVELILVVLNLRRLVGCWFCTFCVAVKDFYLPFNVAAFLAVGTAALSLIIEMLASFFV